ncbi:hypothetical protein TSAR_011275 [Trichomalopsis sarcophagae]|uniref:Uncharacterized protein n=1 Tax=Trichomalopsis sarcophagae TaxID=543379 RepID=A0A232EJX1_9HYME|nr:hypothetical protein TSAR_011275 [Trichomalopsis sarcophagae]
MEAGPFGDFILVNCYSHFSLSEKRSVGPCHSSKDLQRNCPLCFESTRSPSNVNLFLSRDIVGVRILSFGVYLKRLSIVFVTTPQTSAVGKISNNWVFCHTETWDDQLAARNCTYCGDSCGRPPNFIRWENTGRWIYRFDLGHLDSAVLWKGF